MNKQHTKLSKLFHLVLSLGILVSLGPHMASSASANVTLGTIAYVRTTADGDEIRLIEPDGSGDRLLGQTVIPEPDGLFDIQQLAWRPDAGELAFTSRHEENCSIFKSDIYAIRPDGYDYRRVTRPPACGSRAGFPTGTVTVPVYNATFDTEVFTIYFEGAPGPVDIFLYPGDDTSVTFLNVADYGDDQEQYAVAMYGDARSLSPDAHVDVLPGASQETGELKITTGFEHYGYQWPSYGTDGLIIGSIFNKGEVYQIDSQNRKPGELGDPLQFSMPMSSDFLTWGPTPGRASQFLYEGWVDGDTIFLGDLENGSEGQVLITIDPLRIGKTLLGLAWLPDGSGFLYSVTEMENWIDNSDIFEYSFTTGQSRKITNNTYGFIRRMAISPDGQKIVYEYQPSRYWYQENPYPDLWMMNRDGSEDVLLVENGCAPAWSPNPIPDFYTLEQAIPASIAAGGSTFTLQLTGAGFDQESVVRWNDVDLDTVFVSGTRLDATVPASLIAEAGTIRLTVYNAVSGGYISNELLFVVTQAPEPPASPEPPAPPVPPQPIEGNKVCLPFLTK
jgi:hypothetical protein